MAWIKPFLNWVAGMIPTKDDFNRIEGNTQALKDEINAHENAADPHTQYALDSDMNAHVGFGATESAKGHIEIATQAEVTAGTDTTRAVVPKYLKTELDKKLNVSAYTANDVLAKIKTVDGEGSGLDADLLDGKHASDFQTFTKTYGNLLLTDKVTAGGILTKNIPIPAGKKEGIMTIAMNSSDGPNGVCGIQVHFSTQKTEARATGSLGNISNFVLDGSVCRRFSTYILKGNPYGSTYSPVGEYSSAGITDIWINGNNISIDFNNADTKNEASLNCNVAWEVW